MWSRRTILKARDSRLIHSIVYSKFIDFHQWSLVSFVQNNAKKIKKNARVLDAGAGELKYKKYFFHCNYISQDLGVGDDNWDFSQLDIKSSIYEIPEKNNSFDAILCSQVLEHLEFPDLAFKEFARLLKPKGILLLTVPLGQGEHQIPHDYFRYTRYNLKSMGERHGFKLKSLEPHGGIFITIDYVIWQAINLILPFRKYTTIKFIWLIILLPFKIVSSILFIALDNLDRDKHFTINFNCIFEKK